MLYESAVCQLSFRNFPQTFQLSDFAHVCRLNFTKKNDNCISGFLQTFFDNADNKMECFWEIPNFLLLFSHRTLKSPKGITNTLQYNCSCQFSSDFFIMRDIKWNGFGKFRIFFSSFPKGLSKVPRESTILFLIKLQLSNFQIVNLEKKFKVEE